MKFLSVCLSFFGLCLVQPTVAKAATSTLVRGDQREVRGRSSAISERGLIAATQVSQSSNTIFPAFDHFANALTPSEFVLQTPRVFSSYGKTVFRSFDARAFAFRSGLSPPSSAA